ncbi:MAG: metallophosphoesterase family protein [Armatimonadota bacterium]
MRPYRATTITISLIALLLSALVGPGVLRTVDAQAPATLVGAGDIAHCDGDGDEATARLLDGIPGTVFTTGDNVYPDGTDAEFANCFDPTWGRHKARLRPSPGNHDYHTPRAAPYFRYFGAAAGEPGQGFYSYTLGGWLVISLNSNCELIGGCGPDAPQTAWLRRVLAATRTTCTVAYWHHPRFSSGLHGPHAKMQWIWQELYAGAVDVVLGGHDHLYERFGPQDPLGRRDPARGIRQFTVGTGGRSHYAFRTVAPNSEAQQTGTFGVLKLTLRPAHFDWEFVPEAGKTFRDAGSAPCR